MQHYNCYFSNYPDTDLQRHGSIGIDTRGARDEPQVNSRTKLIVEHEISLLLEINQ